MLNRLTSLGVIIFSISSFALFSENNSNSKADLSKYVPFWKYPASNAMGLKNKRVIYGWIPWPIC